jgi:hypothetical protein
MPMPIPSIITDVFDRFGSVVERPNPLRVSATRHPTRKDLMLVSVHDNAGPVELLGKDDFEVSLWAGKPEAGAPSAQVRGMTVQARRVWPGFYALTLTTSSPASIEEQDAIPSPDTLSASVYAGQVTRTTARGTQVEGGAIATTPHSD